MTHATHVVVDTRDGYTFWRNPKGVLFDEHEAVLFAQTRNAGLPPKLRIYHVFALDQVPDERIDTVTEMSWGAMHGPDGFADNH